MHNRRRCVSLVYGLLLLLAASLSSGCVVVPYKPSARVWDSAEVALDPALVLVTAARREFLEEVSDAIRSEDGAITVVDPQVFADAACLDDDERLSRLLTEPACARVREQTAADYLVLVGTQQQESGELQGFMTFYLGFWGAAKETGGVSNLAFIFDLKTAMPLSRVSSKAEGTILGAGVVYGLFVVPLTESSAMDGLARGVVARLREGAGAGPLTIAVMGAEPVRDKSRVVLSEREVAMGSFSPDPDRRMIAARAHAPNFEDEPGPEPSSPSKAALIRSIQEGLRKVGYIWVPADGRLGRWTRAAIRDFQSSSDYRGRVVDEMPSEQLRVDIERAIPKWAPVMQLLPQSGNDGQE